MKVKPGDHIYSKTNARHMAEKMNADDSSGQKTWKSRLAKFATVTELENQRVRRYSFASLRRLRLIWLETSGSKYR